jgi:anti-sigma B factor antagonist
VSLSPRLFHVESSTKGKTQLVRVYGEIDLASVDELRGAIDAALEPGPETLVLDLSEIAFCDSTGIHLVVTSHRRATEQGTRLVVVRPTGPASRTFEICQLDREVELVSSDDGAASPEAPV